MQYWHDGGMPKDKIIIGMPSYGRSFTLADPNNNGLGAPATGAGINGSYTREHGFLAYYEVSFNKTFKNSILSYILMLIFVCVFFI